MCAKCKIKSCRGRAFVVTARTLGVVADSAAVGVSWGPRPFLFCHGAKPPIGPGPPHFRHFAITLRHTTLGGTPLDAWSARRRDIFLPDNT